ncbi:MAG: MFS transporter, partial [Acidimicrobiales bacterium]
ADDRSSRPGIVSTVAGLGRDLGQAARYVRADPRLLSVIGLVGIHCSLTMAFDSMMPTLSEKVGGTSGLYGAILVGLGLGAITGTLSVSQLQRERVRGAVFAGVGIGSGLAMVVLGLAATPTLVVVGALLAGLTQASYMTMSAALIQEIVTDDYRGRVMSLYLMIAAGHMAILNLGYGRVAEVVDVRILLVGPGLAWALIFALSSVGLTEVRSLVRSGRFVSSAKSGLLPSA